MRLFYHTGKSESAIPLPTWMYQLFFCLLLAIPGKAQLPDYHLQLFDYTTGIQPGTIISLAKDNKGFLWILYQRQVQRFDGKQSMTFDLEENLNRLFCDPNGNIWVSSYKHVFKYSDNSREFREVAIASPDSSFLVGDIFGLPGNRIGLLTSKAFFEYNKEQQKFLPLRTPIPLPKPYSVRVFGSYGNILFVRRGKHLHRIDLDRNRVDSLPEKNVNLVYPLNADSALVSTWDNTSYWYNFTRNTIIPANLPPELRDQQFPFLSIRSITRLKPGLFLISAREGIFEYSSVEQKFRRTRFFLEGRKVSTNDYSNQVYLDEDGYAWLATVDGVARFAVNRPSIGLLRVRQLTDSLPASIDNIRKIIEDDRGNLWLATANGLASFDKEKNKWIVILPAQGRTDRLAHPSVRGIGFDGRNILIAPTDLGVWLLEPTNLRFSRPRYDSPETEKHSSRDFFSHILRLQSGDHLFVARDGIYHLDHKTNIFRLLKLPFRQSASCAFQGNNGIIWITTSYELHCLSAKLDYLQKVELPLKDKTINSGFITADDRFLFSTSDGLYTAAYQEGKTEIRKYTGVFDNMVLNSIFQDKNNVVWAASANGIYRFDPLTSKLNLFDYSDNVQGYGFNHNSLLRNRDGKLLFGGVNGINYLDPENYTVQDDSLKVYIHKIVLGNNDSLLFSFDKKQVLKYAQRSVEVEFITPYFSNQAKVKYRYRLSGYDKDWYSTGNNSLVRFTSLSPGDYTLEVQASLNNVDWVNAQNKFSFRIATPFWSSWWFIILSVVVSSLVIYLFVKNRDKKIQEKQEELEAEQAINYFASSMSEQQTEEAILWDVAKNCIGRLQFEDCVIYLLDEDKNVLVQKAAHGPKSPRQYQIDEPLEIALGKGIVGAVAVSGKAEIVNDTRKDPRYIVDDERRDAEISVPLIADGKILGVIDCEHSKKGFFTQKHLSILTTIASLCASKIVRVRAEDAKRQAQQILMSTQQKMNEVEMQALRAQMNPHFIFNCLNSINRYIVKSEQVTASLYLTKFAKLIRLILDNSNSKNVNLTNELEALKLYIEMEALRFDKKFSYEIKVAPGLGTDCVELPPLIIQPYVENAIWHGLLHKENHGHLSIAVSMETEGMLQCIIEDNGVGRQKAQELKSKTATSRKSLGMQLTENRLSLLNNHAQLNASVEIIDLQNGNGGGAGTRVILKIPV